jgi:phosphatidate cytidylyltransferase
MSKDSPKDLKVRTMSAAVMIVVAGSALWAGGWVFTVFVAMVAAGLLWEWWGLISKFNQGALGRVLWMLGGVIYVGGATTSLMILNWYDKTSGIGSRWFLIGLVIFIDTGAYLFGRFIGGPKIAPQISPSKTWAGLAGGVSFACAWIFLFYAYLRATPTAGVNTHILFDFIGFGILTSIIAQIGDFGESWLKRRAGVKDSGDLIPGHGGLFDRLDGLIAVSFLGFFTISALMLLEVNVSHSGNGFPVGG